MHYFYEGLVMSVFVFGLLSLKIEQSVSAKRIVVMYSSTALFSGLLFWLFGLDSRKDFEINLMRNALYFIIPLAGSFASYGLFLLGHKLCLFKDEDQR